MKRHIALGLVASTLFLAGCCTTHQSAKSIDWEYKASLEDKDQASLVDKLNKLAVDGWTIRGITLVQDHYMVFLKRPKQ